MPIFDITKDAKLEKSKLEVLKQKVNVTDMRNLHPEYRGGKKNMDSLITENPELLKDYREKVAKSRYLKRKGKKKDS